MSFDVSLKDYEKNEQERIKKLNEENQARIQKLNDEIIKFNGYLAKIYGKGIEPNDPIYPTVSSFNKRFVTISAKIKQLNLDNPDIDNQLNALAEEMQSLSSQWRKLPPFPQDYVEVVTQYISEAEKNQQEFGFQVQIKKNDPFAPAQRMFSDYFNMANKAQRAGILAKVREDNTSFDRVYGHIQNLAEAFKPLHAKVLEEMQTNHEVSIETHEEIRALYMAHYNAIHHALIEAHKGEHPLTFAGQPLEEKHIKYIVQNFIFAISANYPHTTYEELSVYELFRFIGNNLHAKNMQSAMKDYLLGPNNFINKLPEKVAEDFGVYGPSIFTEVIKSAEESNKNGLSTLISSMNPKDEHQRKFIDLVYSPRLNELMQAVKSISSDYNALKRDTHKDDIRRLFGKIRQINENSQLNKKEKFDEIVNELNKAFKTEQEKYTNPFIGSGISAEQYIQKINSKESSFHYPRLLAVALQVADKIEPALKREGTIEPSISGVRFIIQNTAQKYIDKLTLLANSMFTSHRGNHGFNEFKKGLKDAGATVNDNAQLYRLYLEREDLTPQRAQKLFPELASYGFDDSQVADLINGTVDEIPEPTDEDLRSLRGKKKQEVRRESEDLDMITDEQISESAQKQRDIDQKYSKANVMQRLTEIKNCIDVIRNVAPHPEVVPNNI
ncbi:TPA: hypothetical protein ACTUT5_001852 [Legionella anisa]|uniref:hypothetical protein n=1 Tax=Legionella anisa TaxID=28082 RepID=UPI00197E60BD|nr:hypothetical protein [Legionella anisa]MBN5936454.1 hypothetical protein [Legionella anisa]